MLAYCDYIAKKIQTSLRDDSYCEGSLIHYVDSVEWDLHPDEGYMLSTTKSIGVQDVGGKRYRITVEEV